MTSKSTLQETKRWTVFNAQKETVNTLTDQEFKNLLETNGVKLKGDYVTVNINHPEVSRIQHTQRIWIDAILNSDYFK